MYMFNYDSDAMWGSGGNITIKFALSELRMLNNALPETSASRSIYEPLFVTTLGACFLSCN